jgi:VWFA-related protein
MTRWIRSMKKYKLILGILLMVLPCLAIYAQATPPNPLDEIVLHVAVTDTAGRFVSGLRREAFAIYDNKIPQEIIHFNHDVPVSVGILFDISYSMIEDDNKRFATFAKAKLLELIQLSNSSNEYFIIAFDEHPHLLTDWTSDRNVIAEALSKPVSQESFPQNCCL